MMINLDKSGAVHHFTVYAPKKAPFYLVKTIHKHRSTKHPVLQAFWMLYDKDNEPFYDISCFGALAVFDA
jgi:hypothetical protein